MTARERRRGIRRTGRKGIGKEIERRGETDKRRRRDEREREREREREECEREGGRQRDGRGEIFQDVAHLLHCAQLCC